MERGVSLLRETGKIKAIQGGFYHNSTEQDILLNATGRDKTQSRPCLVRANSVKRFGTKTLWFMLCLPLAVDSLNRVRVLGLG